MMPALTEIIGPFYTHMQNTTVFKNIIVFKNISSFGPRYIFKNNLN